MSSVAHKSLRHKHRTLDTASHLVNFNLLTDTGQDPVMLCHKQEPLYTGEGDVYRCADNKVKLITHITSKLNNYKRYYILAKQ